MGLSIFEFSGVNDLFLFTVQSSLAVIEVVFQRTDIFFLSIGMVTLR